MITNKYYNVDLAGLTDKNQCMILQRKCTLIKKTSGKKSTRDRTLTKLLEPPGLMISASGISKAIILSSNPDELCKRTKFLMQKKKRAGNKWVKINEGMVALFDKNLEDKCMTPT